METYRCVVCEVEVPKANICGGCGAHVCDRHADDRFYAVEPDIHTSSNHGEFADAIRSYEMTKTRIES